MKLKLRLKYFGMIAEHVGVHDEEKEIMATTSDDLKSALELEHFILQTIPYRIAHNKQMIASTVHLRDGDEIALLPPFAGG